MFRKKLQQLGGTMVPPHPLFWRLGLASQPQPQQRGSKGHRPLVGLSGVKPLILRYTAILSSHLRDTMLARAAAWNSGE